MSSLLRQVCTALGIFHTGFSVRELERTLLGYNREGTMLILDEAQNIRLNLWRTLQHYSVVDGQALSLVFCGNQDVLKITNTTGGPLQQISSRIDLREKFDGIEAGDVNAIAASFGVTDPDALALLLDVATLGHARAVVQTLALARKLFPGDQPIAAPQLRQVLDTLHQYRPAHAPRMRTITTQRGIV